jgi:hypothetical protein
VFARRALERAQRKDSIGETAAHRALARSALLSDGDRKQVVEHLERAMFSAERRGSRREIAITRLLRGEAERAWGEPEASRADLSSAASAFEDMAMASYAGRARGLLDLL